MKEQLLLLLRSHPLAKGCSDDYVDTIAEDIMAMVICALNPNRGELLTHRLAELNKKTNYTIN